MAFSDNEAAAAVVDVTESEASIVVVVPPVSTVPQKTTRTRFGALTLRSLTATEKDAFYTVMVCGFLLATARQAFATAPELKLLHIACIRDAAKNLRDKHHAEAVMAVDLSRAGLADVDWANQYANQIVDKRGENLVVAYKGRRNFLSTIDLTREPGIAGIISAVDFDELRSARD